MLQYFLPRPTALSSWIQPFTEYFSLSALPLHIHQVLLAFVAYHFINIIYSPFVSARLFPKHYSHFTVKSKFIWDLNVVRLFKSPIIVFLSLYAVTTYDGSATTDWKERVWGYTASGGTAQAVALAFFLWEIIIAVQHFEILGWPMLLHSISSSLGATLAFRPLFNYYFTRYLLVELITVFWILEPLFEKVDMGKSRAQLCNSVILLVSFFICRILWGPYLLICFYRDVWATINYSAFHHNIKSFNSTIFGISDIENVSTIVPSHDDSDIMIFAGPEHVPVWIALTIASSVTIINILSFYWFGRILRSVRNRYDPQSITVKGTQDSCI